jgi:hypothetical protein
MDAAKIKRIQELPMPTTKKNVQSVLGMFSYYRKFIPDFAKRAQPMYDCIKSEENIEEEHKECKSDELKAILKKGSRKFLLTEEAKEGFLKLKEKFLKDVILYYPDFQKATMDVDDPEARLFHILVDASYSGMGAALCQKDDTGFMRPLYFTSRRVTKAERKYHSNELETLAIVYACEKLQQFIFGITTVVLTDNSTAASAFKTKFECKNSRIDRWVTRIKSKFDLIIKHTPGRLNTVADFFSRYGHEDDLEPITPNDSSGDKDEFIVGLMNPKKGYHVWAVETRRQVKWKREKQQEIERKNEVTENLRSKLNDCE